MRAPGDDEVLDGLRRHARQLVAELAGPVRRVRLRHGDTVLEVEWHGPAEAVPTPWELSGTGLDAAVGNGAPAAARVASAGGDVVRAPVVGTFYHAPEPGASPFVAVGDLVRPGRVVGIVEAMKLMNEVTVDRAGRVLELLVGDGEPVEFDQPLIRLGPG